MVAYHCGFERTIKTLLFIFKMVLFVAKRVLREGLRLCLSSFVELPSGRPKELPQT
jgi:hypothetical protein